MVVVAMGHDDDDDDDGGGGVVVVICDDLVLIFDLLNTIYAIRYILMKPQNLTENKGDV